MQGMHQITPILMILLILFFTIAVILSLRSSNPLPGGKTQE